MCIKTDRWIREQVGMITPFEPQAVREGVVSYGLSSMGYDFRLGNEFAFVRPGVVGSPKNKDAFESSYRRIIRDGVLVLHPHSYTLAQSLEYFEIPDDVLGIVYGKSTYARLGVMLNMTPIEPGWKGHMTLSIVNHSGTPVELFTGEGIGQIVFYQADEVPLVTYATKQGKYQDARGIQTARVD